MKTRLEIPIERIAEVLRYDPDTGKLFWRKKIAPKCVVGREAGNGTGRRDIRISVDGVLYQAHRLAWVIMTGEQPPTLVDHADLDTRNNKWTNLRAASMSDNGANRPTQSNSRSGVKGVYHYPTHSPARPWLARLQRNGVIVLNRYFPTQAEAAAAYESAAKEAFGQFART